MRQCRLAHNAAEYTSFCQLSTSTTMLSSQVPLAMAPKTLRHPMLSTTTEIYGHLLKHVALDAVQAIETALAKAGSDNSRDQPRHRAPIAAWQNSQGHAQ